VAGSCEYGDEPLGSGTTELVNSTLVYASVYSCTVMFRWFIEFCFLNVIVVPTLSHTCHYYYQQPVFNFSCW
jgi:hypothetical protein